MTICIIPARKNSKRIKNKNIIDFLGKPIISYAINVAKKSKIFKRIIVTTDCKKIKKIAEEYGAEVPFLRSKKLSDDYTNTIDVIIDTIRKISSENEKFHCCIYPTSILTETKDLKKALKKIKNSHIETLIPVTDYNFSPYRSFKIDKKNSIKFLYDKFAKKRSQDLPELFHDTGSFYFFRTSSLIKKKSIVKTKNSFLKIDRIKTIDINDKQDLTIAKLKYKFLNNK